MMLETEIHYCDCGCGGVPKPGSRFLKGHNLRINNPSKKSEVAKKIAKSNTGKKRTLESIAKQINTTKNSPVFKEAMKNRKPPRTGTSTSLQGRKNIGKASEGRKKTPEQRENVRQSLLRYFSIPENLMERARQINENNVTVQFKTGYISLAQSPDPIFYRSSYEKIALMLLGSKIEVSNIQTGKVYIPYVDGLGKERIYIPDFLVTLRSGKQLLIEVKPKNFVDFDPRRNGQNFLKHKAAQKWAQENGIDFCIWTEDTLHNDSSTTTSLQAIVEATVANLSSERLKV